MKRKKRNPDTLGDPIERKLKEIINKSKMENSALSKILEGLEELNDKDEQPKVKGKKSTK